MAKYNEDFSYGKLEIKDSPIKFIPVGCKTNKPTKRELSMLFIRKILKINYRIL